jgi:hypothetical protein
MILAYSKYDTVLINGLVVIKTVYKLNDIPLSDLNKAKLPIACTTKNVHKNKPVKATISFCPIDDENILVNQFISVVVC